MGGYFQIIIGLICIYLVFKGVEIFQIAYTSRPENPNTRTYGMMLGMGAIAAAVIIGVLAVIFTGWWEIAFQESLKNIKL